MTRTLFLVTAFLATLPVLLFTTGSGRAAEGQDEGIYVVRPGDSLSGIAGRLLGDYRRWREILDENPQITDPELIFPGDALALPGFGEGAEDDMAISGGEEVDVQRELYPPLPVTPAEDERATLREPAGLPPPAPYVKPVPVISQNLYRSAGFISDTLPEGSIVSAVPTKHALAGGDEVVISLPAEAGAAFTVVRPTQKVYHPRSGEFLGWVLRVLGWAEVNCPGEKASRAMLTGALDTIHVGDLLLPYDPDDILKENRIGEKRTTYCLTEKRDSYLLASQEERVALGEGDIVFLDRGKKNGVVPGDQFVVYRPLHPEGVNVIGQLQVIRVGERTSTAIVINSMMEISITDSVQSWDPAATARPAFGG